MNTDASLKFLVSYKLWADNILYDALSVLPTDQLTVERPMLFGSILKLLNHVYAMDKVWKHNLEGTGHDFKTRNPENTPQFGGLKNDQSELNHWYKEYVIGLSPEKVHEKVAFRFIGGEESAMKRSDVIQHIVNHSTYHRGHIEGVLYQISVEPPTTDMPVFIKENLTDNL